MRAGLLSIVLAAAFLTGCAATIPPAATFAPSQWRAVEALSPGTLVNVLYVAATPAPLRHSFRGTIESVTSDSLIVRTPEGSQRMLASRVLRVSTLTRQPGSGARGAIIGAAALILIGAPVLQAINETSLRPEHVIIPAALGGVIGALIDLNIRRDHGHVIYRR